jgi:hypothetical protein
MSRPAPPRNIGGIASRLAPTRTAPPMTAVSTSTPPAERRPAGCARCGRAEVERPHRTVAGGVATPGVPRHWLPSRPVHWSWRTRRTRRARPGSRDQAPAPFKRGKTAVEQVSSKHRQVAGPAAPFCPSGAARHSARAERQGTLPERSGTARCPSGAAPHGATPDRHRTRSTGARAARHPARHGPLEWHCRRRGSWPGAICRSGVWQRRPAATARPRSRRGLSGW